jgi:trehalose/maltose hydrolase-like predicted phosphorylase
VKAAPRPGPRLEPWSLVYDHYDPDDEPTREALCTLGNGRFATRGAGSEVLGAAAHHYPGTYAAGIYARLTSRVAPTSQSELVNLEHEALVNLPNWLPLRVQLDNGVVFTTESCEVQLYHQELDFAHGVLKRELRLCDGRGQCLTIREQRLVHMRETDLAAISLEIEPQDYSGHVSISSMIDGEIRNTNADEYEGLESQHLDCVDASCDEREVCALRARTRQSRIEIAVGTRTRVWLQRAGHAQPVAAKASRRRGGRIELEFGAELVAGDVLSIEKLCSIHTSRDSACSEPLESTLRTLASAQGFAALADGQARAWRQLWSCFALELPAHPRTVAALRLHLFHILQTVSAYCCELDAGIPARGLHGENYRGHVFWDELFIFPVLTLRWPELTRALLLYRYRRLPEARRQARRLELAGAVFPWRSASDGRDVTERWRRNPSSGRFIADHSHLQRHVNAAIAYNVWQYYQATSDHEFLCAHGAELILSIAQFWSSAAQLATDDRRYHLHGVVGPDEFHDAYPGAERPGIDDNAYTNVMAVWSLLRALDVVELLPERVRLPLLERLGIDAKELARWDDVTRRMFVPFRRDGSFDQFAGFQHLAEFDLAAYRERYGDVHRLDNILEAEGDSTNRYQVCKQADVLMLFYLLSPDELTTLIERLGYALGEGFVQRNVQQYIRHTTHGSTLSRVVQAWVLCRFDPERSFQTLCEALGSDLHDIQGGSTREGIHIAAMGGTIDVFQRAYLGLEIRAEKLHLDPQVPPELRELRLRLRYRMLWLELEVSPDSVRIRVDAEGHGHVIVRLCGRDHELGPGDDRILAYP